MSLSMHCNVKCAHCCRSYCNIDHTITDNSSEALCHTYICNVCLCKYLPFYKISNNEFHFTIKDTFREVINRFQNVQFDQVESNDNITPCRYLELDEVKEHIQNDNKSPNFSILNVNIVSLSLNIDKLRTILYGLDSTPDIIAVTETRITKNNVLTNDIDLNGYKFIFDDAPDNGRPSGAGLFIKDGVDFKILNDLK